MSPPGFFSEGVCGEGLVLVLSSGPSVVCGLLLWWPLWSAWPLLVPMGGMLAPMATEPSPRFPVCVALVSTTWRVFASEHPPFPLA